MVRLGTALASTAIRWVRFTRNSDLAHSKKNASNIQPVILCGGSGSRLWPVSRKALPKQFIKLVSDRTMFQDTALWVCEAEGYRAPLIVSNEAFRFHVADQMREIGVEPSAVILEPHSRNTAAAIALAALVLSEKDPDACMLVMPSDHVLGGKQAGSRWMSSPAMPLWHAKPFVTG